MAGRELTEEDIMLSDEDPMDALRRIRSEEGVPEEDLPQRTDVPSDEVLDTTEESETVDETADEEELDEVLDQKTDDTETDEQETDTEDGTDETTTAEKKEASTEEAQGPVTRKFKANGQEFEFTREEIEAQFETVFGKAMDYTQKMQKIAPYRKMISALEQEGITHSDLNIAIDALKGDQGAIKKLLENHNIDPYELATDADEASPYTPKVYGKDDTTLEIEEITSKISGDEEFKITTYVIDQAWDDGSRQAIVKNPSIIIGLHNDVKSGIYDKVAPAAMKLKVLDGNAKSDLEYYMLAGAQFQQAMEAQQKTAESQKTVADLNKDAQDADSKFDKASSEADRKRAASSTGSRADRKGVIDYLDDDDEAYDEWYKKLHDSI